MHKSTPFHIVKNAIYTIYTIVGRALQSELSLQGERQKAIGLDSAKRQLCTPSTLFWHISLPLLHDHDEIAHVRCISIGNSMIRSDIWHKYHE